MSIPQKPTKNISDVASQVQSQVVPPPRHLEELLSEETISSVRELINKYNTIPMSSLLLVTMQDDLAQVEAIKLGLALDYSHLIGFSESSSDLLKNSRARASNSVRNIVDSLKSSGEVVRATVDDLTNLAYIKSGASETEELRQQGISIKYFYYALKDLGDKLERAITRFWQLERNLTKMSEEHNPNG